MRFIIIGGGCYGIYHSGQLHKAILKGKLPADSRLIIVDRNAEPKALQVHGNKANFEFVQSDWQAFLQNFFANPASYQATAGEDEVQIVPAPFAPHLFFDWLQFSITERLKELGREDIEVEREGFDYKMNLPYEYTDKIGNHYISRAGWICPSSCIEPRLCPAVKGPRDWDLADDLVSFVSTGICKPSHSALPKLDEAKLANGTTALLQAPPFEAGFFRGIETFTCHHFSHGIGTTPARQLFESRNRMVDLALSLNSSNHAARVAVGTLSHCHGVVAALKISSKIGVN